MRPTHVSECNDTYVAIGGPDAIFLDLPPSLEVNATLTVLVLL